MLESALRHMGSNEPVNSPLHAAALDLIISKSSVLKDVWSGMNYTLDKQPVGGDLSLISLHITLWKLRVGDCHLRLDRMATTQSKEMPLTLPTLTHVLNQVYDVTRRFRPMWHAKCMSAVSEELADHHSGDRKASCSSNGGHQPVQAWLRLELILIRTCVVLQAELVWRDLEASHIASALHAALKLLATNLRQECGVDSDSPLMEAVLSACGLDHAGVLWHPSERMARGHAQWERFAFNNLQGRALPGCSYWGCCNLLGFSETMLPTKLCSGCRRARYCSVECQQFAWVLNGHRQVCGEFG